MQQYRWMSESTQKMKMTAAGVLGPGQSHSATPLPRWCRCQTHQWQRSRGSHRGRHVTRGHEGTIHKKSTVPRTAVAGNCLLLPLCESQQRFVEQGALCYCNQQLREERGRVGWGRDDDRGGGGGGRDGDVVGEEKR